MMMQYSKAQPIETVYTYTEWEKIYKWNQAHRKAKTDAIITQIILGIALVMLGIVAVIIMPEDATGGVLFVMMGVCVILGNLKKKNAETYDIID